MLAHPPLKNYEETLGCSLSTPLEKPCWIHPCYYVYIMFVEYKLIMIFMIIVKGYCPKVNGTPTV
jgi:hypothetical protein